MASTVCEQEDRQDVGQNHSGLARATGGGNSCLLDWWTPFEGLFPPPYMNFMQMPYSRSIRCHARISHIPVLPRGICEADLCQQTLPLLWHQDHIASMRRRYIQLLSTLIHSQDLKSSGAEEEYECAPDCQIGIPHLFLEDSNHDFRKHF